MHSRSVLQFYTAFFLFVAAIALIHATLPPPITGYAISSDPSVQTLNWFAISLFIGALFFLFLSLRRFVPREVIRRIELRDRSTYSELDT